MSRRQSGFTLLEMVVVLALLGLLMAGLTNGLGFFLRFREVGDKGSDATAAMARLDDLLRRQVEGALWMRPGNAGQGAIAFEGTRHGLQFLIAAPSYPTAAGIYLVSFAAVAGPERTSLSFARAPYDGGSGDLNLPDDAPSSVIADLPGDFAFSYFDGQQWTGEWHGRPELPRLVRLRVTDRSRRLLWSEMTMRPAVEAELACPDPRPAANCRGRR